MKQTIRTMLELTPETLAEKQHAQLTEHVKIIFNKISSALTRRDYAEAKKYAFESGSGDGWGRDDTCLNFYGPDDANILNFGEVIEKLESLSTHLPPINKKEK